MKVKIYRSVGFRNDPETGEHNSYQMYYGSEQEAMVSALEHNKLVDDGLCHQYCPYVDTIEECTFSLTKNVLLEALNETSFEVDRVWTVWERKFTDKQYDDVRQFLISKYDKGVVRFKSLEIRKQFDFQGFEEQHILRHLVAEGLLKEDKDFPITYEIQNPLDQHDARVEQGGHHDG